MQFYCPYCLGLKKAFKDHNYCSNNNDTIESVKSNAFYMNSQHVHSGKHISRLSIRGVLNGYQYYKTGSKDKLVKQDNYLIINQGQSWYSEINSETPVEMIVVAFHPDFLKKAAYSLSASSEDLLDNPFTGLEKEINYFENTYPNDPQIKNLFLQLKKNIISEEKSELFYEQIYFELYQLMLNKHQSCLKQAELLPTKKQAVKKELYQRLGNAKDYMNVNLGKKISLQEISSAVALSPYHFLRLFKALYKITPHQYLTSERMKYAYHLLSTSYHPIKEISFRCGFDDQSSFTRVFKSHFNKTPLQIRKQKFHY